MKSEHTANLSLVVDTEQNHLPQHQVKQANEAARQRKRDINAQFWHSIKSVVFVISCAAIAVYTLIHFAGKA